MNKASLIKAATVLVPVLTLGIIATSVSAASPTTATSTQNARPVLTTEQKTTLDQIRELRKAGKIGGEDMKMKFGHGRGPGMMMNAEMRKDRQAIAEAIKNNDYTKFVELTKNAPFATQIDQAKFAKLVEASKLMEQAHTILKDAGIRMPMPMMHDMPVKPPTTP